MLRRVGRAAGIGCWELDLSTGAIVGSEGMRDILGLAHCGDLWRQLQEAAIPEYRIAIQQALDDLIAGVAPFAVEFKAKRINDGKIVDLYSTAEYDRTTRKVFGVIQDITVRKAAETELAESESRYRSLFQDNTSPMLLIDPEDGRIIDANSAAAAFYGWSRRHLRSMRIQQINTLSEQEVRAEMRAAAELKRNHFNFKHKIADGSIRDVEVYSGPISVGGKNLLYSIIHDVTDARRTQLENERLLKEKELLLKEVHHRIKNNMVTIDSLLALQSDTLADETACSAINEARSRILGMMGLYDKLYRSQDFRTVNIREYFESLMNEIRNNFGKDRPIEFKAHVEDIRLDTRILVPLAIIINELVINSLKYAFPEGRPGIISLSIKTSGDGAVSVSVGDNGIGRREGGSKGQGGFGLALVSAFATQLGAKMESETEVGTRYRFTFTPQTY
jgi:PAS domain S-box-containing protein